MNNKKLLIISCHADDHLSCAGTVFKLQEDRGFTPFEVVMTDSSRGQDKRVKKQANRKSVALTRLKELSEASKFLGIKKTFMLNQTDLELRNTPEVVFEVVKVIREVKPLIVFINGEFDAHPDHRTAFRIGLDALKIAAMNVDVKKLGEPFRVPEILCVEQMLPDRVQVLVDITKFVDKKEQLLSIYTSQMSPKSLNFERGMLAVRGYQLRKSDGLSAEAFTLQNEFPILAFEEEDATGIF